VVAATKLVTSPAVSSADNAMDSFMLASSVSLGVFKLIRSRDPHIDSGQPRQRELVVSQRLAPVSALYRA
jgi:hypothetical protein